MAWTFLGEIVGNYDTTVGVETVGLSSLGLQEGDLVIVAQSADSSLASLGLDRTQGFTIEYSPADTSPGRLFGWKLMGASPDTNIDFNDGSAYHNYIIQGWRGADTASGAQPAAPTPANATGASVNPDSPDSDSSLIVDDLVFSIAHMDDDDTTVASNGTPSGYSNMSEINTGQASSADGATTAIASKQLTSAGIENPGQWTLNASDAWAAYTVAFRMEAGSTGSPWNYYRQLHS